MRSGRSSEPEGPSAIELRAVTSDADLERLLGVKARIDPILASTSEEVRFLMAWLRGPRFCSRRWTASRRASAWSASSREQEDEPFAYAELGVARGFEGQGSAELSTRPSPSTRVLGKTEPSSKWGRRTAAPSPSSRSGATARSSGQKAVALELGPLEPPPIETPGDGDPVLGGASGSAPGHVRLYREANADIPGLDAEAEMSFEDWRVQGSERPARRHDLSFVAVAGDELVGLATLDIFPAGGFHGRRWRAWRRHGVGRALKRAQIAAAKAAGLERLYTESEERNEPMRRLNEQLGFRPIPGMVVMRGPLVF